MSKNDLQRVTTDILNSGVVVTIRERASAGGEVCLREATKVLRGKSFPKAIEDVADELRRRLG